MRLLPIALLFAWGTVSVAKPPLASLCDKGDEVFFTCSTGKKTISVCSSKGWKAEKGFLQYRFGRPGKIELTIPKDKATPPKSVASYHQLMYSGGGGAAVRFTGDGTDYVVYSGIGKGWKKEGVAIEKEGERIADVRCQKGEPQVDISALIDGGLKASSADFEIPE